MKLKSGARIAKMLLLLALICTITLYGVQTDAFKMAVYTKNKKAATTAVPSSQSTYTTSAQAARAAPVAPAPVAPAPVAPARTGPSGAYATGRAGLDYQRQLEEENRRIAQEEENRRRLYAQMGSNRKYI